MIKRVFMVEQKLKKLPLGLSDFGEIRREYYVYVDKTELIYQLITSGKYYFISRPRRFGKSLLVSILDELFSGNKKIFENLWIFQSDYLWLQHPVIKIDFSDIDYSRSDRLEKSLLKCLYSIGKQYKIKLAKTESPKDLFSELIDTLSLKNKVIILVDEYDKPIVDNIHKLEKAEEQRAILQNFYSTIKAKDAKLRFVLLTGVSKFSKTSVFSGLNNLVDISMDSRYATLFGYTQQELTDYFPIYLDRLAKVENKTHDDVVQEIMNYYDGYQFAANSICVLNPFSVLLCFDSNKLDNYWFQTGTPTFLIKLLQKNNYDLESIMHPTINALDLGSFELDNVPLPSLLLQTGYLTIKSYDSKTNNYTLGVPNKEVSNCFTRQLVNAFTLLPIDKSIEYARLITNAFGRGDVIKLQKKLQEFFNRMPYTVHVDSEHSLQFVLYAIFALIGVAVDPEVTTSLGRADLVVSFPKLIYIIELKFNKTAQQALEQIRDKKYYEKYLNTGKQITLLGINFDQQTKTVSLECDHVD